MNFKIVFGNKIKQIRIEKKMSITEFAELTGFTSSYISKIENYKINPTIKSVLQFCKKLNLKIDYFF
ncbi:MULTISPECIES: helix-turn-helix domain-containing protein [Bacillus]|uniref:Transcriptional regulator n=1 Tax=Bacillus pumilus TaxID=1408 RepID=A0AAD0HPG9_BACPU|nr:MULTISPECIES: helix-turn-helix transcriptional regulator [Bacillus]AVM24923.1 transcriptional regulator [Bacillus pumilus]TYS42027.1 helix-turn-helix transcriptional regulator [Bacillus pumilus]WAT79677.1 helix-turn-helix transcriptional regulator [Bacillus safensis]